MKKLLLLLFISAFSFAQDYDFQELCIACAEANGFYCGDDVSNWTQYSPLGCVPNGVGGLFYLNDNWNDCVDGSDEQDAVPTPIEQCVPQNECDTVYVEVPIIQTDTIIQTEYLTDTIVEFQEIIITEYIDCVTGLPCNSGMQELLDKSKNTGLLYDLNGKIIKRAEGIYIQNGLIKYKL